MGLQWRNSDKKKSEDDFFVKNKRQNNLSYKQLEVNHSHEKPKEGIADVAHAHNKIIDKYDRNYDEAYVHLHEDAKTSEMYYDLLDRTKADDTVADWHRGKEYWDTRPNERDSLIDRYQSGKKIGGMRTNLGQVGPFDYKLDQDWNYILDDKVRSKGYDQMKKWVENSIKKDAYAAYDKGNNSGDDKFRRFTISLYIMGNYPRLKSEVKRSPSFTMYEKWRKKYGK